MTELQKEKKKAPCLLNEIQTQIQNVHIVKRQWLRALAKHLMQYHNSFLQYFSNNNNKTITAFLKLGWFNFVFCFIPFSFANVIKFEEKENKI